MEIEEDAHEEDFDSDGNETCSDFRKRALTMSTALSQNLTPVQFSQKDHSSRQTSPEESSANYFICRGDFQLK